LSNGRIIGLAASVLIVALVVAASLGYFSQRVGTPSSSISERFTTINGSTFVIINNSTTESVSCVVLVPPPHGIYLRVNADGAGTPVSGLRVTTQSTEAASCDRKNVLLTNSIAVTNSSGWILFREGYPWYFVFTYSGHTYNFTVPSGPLSWSVATISVPSGKLSTEICGLGGGSLNSSCEAASTTNVLTNSVSSSRSPP